MLGWCNFFDVSLLRNWAAINRCVTRKKERTMHEIGCLQLGRHFEIFCGSGMLRGGMMQWSNVFTRLLSQSAMMWWVYSMCGWNCDFFFFNLFWKLFFFLTVKKKKKCVYPSILFHLKVCVTDMCPRQSNVSFSQINFYICAKIHTSPESFSYTYMKTTCFRDK